MKQSLHQSSERGAALVVTMIVCVVLAMVVVALMQNTTLDRSTSQAIANNYRAQLAAESGLAQAMWAMSAAIGTNPNTARNFIVAETNPSASQSPVLLIGTNEAAIPTNMVPMISGDISGYLTNRTQAALDAILAKRTTPDPATNVDMNMGSLAAIQTSNTITAGAATNWWRAPWVLLTNTTTSQGGTRTNLSRYAFIVVDEQARLNPFFHQGFTNAPRTNYGRSALEICVDSTNALIVSNAGKLSAITNAGRSAILTSDTLGLADLFGDAYRTNKHLVSTHSVIDEDIIPAGYMGTNTNFIAYADAGKPKYNINELATNGASPEKCAEKIAGIISQNLTNFFKRDLASVLTDDPPLPPELYPRRIASSIVDYIDTDTSITPGLNGELAGKELAPYVVMVAEKNSWTKEDPPPPASNNITVEIETQFFVQLWNPYTVPVSGTVGLQVLRRQYLELPNGGPQTDFEDYQPAAVALAAPLQPNEMRSIAFAPKSQKFVHPTARPSANKDNYPTWPNTSSGSSDLTGHPQFRFTWNGVSADMNRQVPEMQAPAKSGLSKQSPGKQFGPVGAKRWGFNFCPANPANTVGDPRATFTTESDWSAASDITKALWQGRQDDTAGRRQDFKQLWSYRDYVRADLPQGKPLPTTNSDPVTIASTYSFGNDAKNAPVFLRNGPMLSVGELGNIFDAAQVNDAGTNAKGATQGFFRPAGGRSLRIGQPESPYWDEGGKRAVQLLDLFTINPPGTNVVELGSSAYKDVPVMRGRININTAPKQVLASVFEGLNVTSDQGANVGTVSASRMADAVASNRPYSRISDLYKPLGDFVNATNYGGSVTNVTVTISNAAASSTTNYVAMAAMDRAREELFARTVNLFGTQSRAFRIFVIGETLDNKTNPVSRAALEAAVQLEAEPGQSVLKKVIKWKKSL